MSSTIERKKPVSEEDEIEEGEIEEEDEIEEDEDEIEEEEEIEIKKDVPTEIKKPTTRKPRTKKVYPPSEDMFDELIRSMSDLRDLTRKIITLTKATQKSTRKDIRDLTLKIKKEKTDVPARKPRGFALPSPISNEMVDYLTKEAGISQIERKINEQTSCPIKIEYGCSLARNELTSALCNHFKTSQMRKNEADKRDIHLDTKTAKLFGIDVKTFSGRLSAANEPIITYFDLQKYIPRHCGKLSLTSAMLCNASVKKVLSKK
jgi:hypothetical protein